MKIINNSKQIISCNNMKSIPFIRSKNNMNIE